MVRWRSLDRCNERHGNFTGRALNVMHEQNLVVT
jgi:hypothetical protein